MRMVADKTDVLRVMSALRVMANEAANPQELLQEVATRAVYPSVEEIFDNEGYGAWAGYTERYALWKERSEFADQPMLQLRGDLKGSLTLQGAPGNIHQFAGDGSLVIGSALPYAGVAVSQRPIAEQTQERHFDDMARVAAEHLARTAGSLGFEVTVE